MICEHAESKYAPQSVQKVDSICAEHEQGIRAVIRDGSRPSTYSGGLKPVAKLAPILCSLTLLGLALAGLKSFDLTYQAWDLWWEGETPVSAFLQGHPHAMRYVVYYPIFVAAVTADIPVDTAFGLVCVVVFCILTFAMSGIEQTFQRATAWRPLAYSSVFLALAIVMNGRLLFAFCGFALVILAFRWADREGWNARTPAALSIGLLFTSVSSGTLAVAAIYCVIAAGHMLTSPKKSSDLVAMALTLAILLALFSSTLWIGFFKNVDYFGGGIQGFIGMLDHGMGRVFLKLGTVGIALSGLVVVGGLAASAHLLRALNADYRLVFLAVIPAAIGGLFGISTLAVGLVPLLVLARWDLFRP